MTGNVVQTEKKRARTKEFDGQEFGSEEADVRNDATAVSISTVNAQMSIVICGYRRVDLPLAASCYRSPNVEVLSPRLCAIAPSRN